MRFKCFYLRYLKTQPPFQLPYKNRESLRRKLITFTKVLLRCLNSNN